MIHDATESGVGIRVNASPMKGDNMSHTEGAIGFYDHPYIVSFRIDTITTSDAEYDKRLKGLQYVLSQVAITPLWKDPTSCIVFRSNRGIESVSAAIARVLDHALDLAIVVRLDGAETRYIGKVDDPKSLLAALPYARKLG